MKMTMRKMLAILATLAMLCTVLPLGTLFSATAAEGDVILDKDFEDGNAFFTRSVVENGYIVFDATTADWQNTYAYVNALKANTDYTVSFKAKANKDTTMNFKVNDNWAKDAAAVKVDVTTEWQNYEFEINMESLSTGIVMFSSNSNAANAAIYYIDDVKIVEGKIPEAPAVENLLSGSWSPSSGSSAVEEDGALHVTYGDDWGFIQTTVNVEANTDYVFTFEAKAANGGTLNANFNKTDWSGNIHKQGFSLTEEWATYTYEFTSGSETAYMLFLQSGHPASDNFQVWYKNVTLYKAVGGDEPDEPDEPVTPPADGDVLNATFDTDDFDGILSSSDISVADGVLQFNVTTDWGNVYTGFEVEANTDYEVSFRAKSALGKTVWVKFHKADWSGDICQETVALTTDWKDYTYTMNSGDNTYVYLLVQYAGYAAEGETVWFDYITVKKAGGGDEPDEPSSDALLVNGGFENGSEGWELGSSASITDEDSHGGDYSLKLENPGMWAAAAVQNVSVKPNTEYVIEMWVNRVENKGAMNLFMMDAADNRNLSVVEGQNWFNTNTNGWEKRTIVIDTGAATEIVLKWSAEAANAGIMLVDDMSIAEKNAPQPSNDLVQDSGFESGVLNSNIVPVGVAGAWYNVWGSCTTTFETPGYDGSNYALTIETEGKWTQVRQDKIPVKPNTDYVVWARVKNTTGMSIVMKDGNDTVGITTDEQGAIPEDMTNSWMLHKLEFNSGEYDSICLLLIAIAENGGMGTFDDVQIYEKGNEPGSGDTYPIKNAGFETGDLTNWENLYGSCNVSFDTPGHDGSNYALNFEGPGAWNQVRQDGVPVEPNTDYTLIAYVKNSINLNLVVKTADDSTNIADYAVANDMSNSWIRHEVSFNSGEETNVCVLIISNGDGNGAAIVDNVQIYKKGEEPEEPEPDAPATEGPMSLDKYGVSYNRPGSDDANLIVNGSFEDAEGGQWQSILGDTLYVVDDETAPEGSKSLYFNTSGVTENNKYIFYVDVEPNTDYVFSAWVKGAFISADNRFNATFGVTDWKDKFCTYADQKFSNKERQIVPTAWDNEWHLRSVQFNSGVNVKVGIGFAGSESQMWLDGLALFTVDNGIKYTDPKQVHIVTASPSEEIYGGCADEHNLVVDSSMASTEAQEFWASAEGFKNGFISFPENEYEYGTSLKYTGDDESCYTHAIKWLEVEPNTEYTFSVDVRVVKSGNGSLMLLDGKMRDCKSFLTIDFDQISWDTVDWFNVTMTFNSGLFDRIGIAIVDGGGEALIDNMRLFKSEYCIEGGVEDEYVEPPYSFDDPEDPENPDSPATGVSVMGAVLAVALVPASAAAAFKLRRKKEDEE